MTNHHVIEGARLITLKAADGRRGTASVLRSDSRRDLALLTDPLGLPQLALSPSQQQRVGDPILVMGYPQADVLGTGTATLTRGIISAIRPDIPGLQGVLHLQTDAATNPGNSGGPWVNMRGGLIGVHRAKLRESQGINIAVASDEVQGFLTGPAAVVPSPVATSRPAPPAQPQPTAAPTPSAQKREMIAAADWLDAVVARGGTANQANDHRTLFSLYEQVRARAHPPQTNALYDAARDLLSAAGRRAKLIDDYPYIEIDGRTYNVLTNPSAYNVWVAAVNLETSKVDTALSQYQTAWANLERLLATMP